MMTKPSPLIYLSIKTQENNKTNSAEQLGSLSRKQGLSCSQVPNNAIGKFQNPDFFHFPKFSQQPNKAFVAQPKISPAKPQMIEKPLNTQTPIIPQSKQKPTSILSRTDYSPTKTKIGKEKSRTRLIKCINPPKKTPKFFIIRYQILHIFTDIPAERPHAVGPSPL